MDSAAYEIKTRILDEILHDSQLSEATRRSCLKTLRRTCRAWSELPLPYLFSVVQLGLWGSAGLQRLHAISECPRIAQYVEEIVFKIDFNIADPHPTPFSRSNQKRASAGFWQQDESSTSRLKKLTPSFFKSSRRKSSVTANPRGQSVVSLTSASDVDALLKQFGASARDTIANNLGRTKYAPSSDLPPILSQLAFLLSTVFSSFPNLLSLCLFTQSQTDFINSFAHGFALRFSPVFGTFNSISDLITTTVLCGWIHSSQPLHTLGIIQGSPFALSRFLQQCDYANPRALSTGPPTANGTATFPSNHSTLSTKLSHLITLTIFYDEGHYDPSDTDIASRIARRSLEWTRSLSTLMTLTPNLTSLTLGRYHPISPNDPPYLFTLDPATLSGSSTPNTAIPLPFKLSTLNIGGFSTTYNSLASLIAVFNGPGILALRPSGTLRKLTIHGMRLETGTWRQCWLDLHDNLQLDTFHMVPGIYEEVGGRWIRTCKTACKHGNWQEWAGCEERVGGGMGSVGRTDGGENDEQESTLAWRLARWIERKREWLGVEGEDLRREETWIELMDMSLCSYSDRR